MDLAPYLNTPHPDRSAGMGGSASSRSSSASRRSTSIAQAEADRATRFARHAQDLARVKHALVDLVAGRSVTPR